MHIVLNLICVHLFYKTYGNIKHIFNKNKYKQMFDMNDIPNIISCTFKTTINW